VAGKKMLAAPETISDRRSIGLYNACHDRYGSCKRNAPSGEFAGPEKARC